jgi:hypothetical protein
VHLIYVDESGNTGTNLTDKAQPLFVLAALVVPDHRWIQLEKDLEEVLERRFPTLKLSDGGIHAVELRSGHGPFKGLPVSERIALRDEWLQIAASHRLKVVYRAILKRKFQAWLQAAFGTGVLINPHVAAFALISRVIDEFLARVSATELGIFISDENKEIVRDVEKSIKVLRGRDGTLRLNRIIEKGFFIDSSKSRILQLCDVMALTLRKMEERKAGIGTKSIDDEAIRLIEPLIHRGNEALVDVLNWLSEEQARPGK